MPPKLVILDRDGTLVRVPNGTRYLYGLDPIVLLPGAGAALRHLAARGIVCVVATNQQGVSLAEFPLMTRYSVDTFNQRLSEEVVRLGGRINRFYVCPHLATEGCECRKPRPGLFLAALDDYKVTPDNAVGIGNSQQDVDAARAAGIRAVAVPCTEGAYVDPGTPAYRTLLHAVRFICGGSGKCGRVHAAPL
jgi:D-glycero-D-manno-heptose 1,7-bisphosphate phosphatase